MDTITYSIKTDSRAKKLILSVKKSGEVVLTLPKGVPAIIGKRFVETKTEWIKTQLFKVTNSKNKAGTGTREEYLKNKEIARKIVAEKL